MGMSSVALCRSENPIFFVSGLADFRPVVMRPDVFGSRLRIRDYRPGISHQRKTKPSFIADLLDVIDKSFAFQPVVQLVDVLAQNQGHRGHFLLGTFHHLVFGCLCDHPDKKQRGNHVQKQIADHKSLESFWHECSVVAGKRSKKADIAGNIHASRSLEPCHWCLSNLNIKLAKS